MLTINLIREKADEVISRLKVKNFDAAAIVSEILKTDEERRSTQTKLDNTLAELNTISKEIGTLIRENKKEEAEERKNRTVVLKNNIAELSGLLEKLEFALRNLAVKLPNLPSKYVPEGKGAEDNVIDREGGNMPQLDEKALPHWDLAKMYDIIDFDLGNKLTGAGFPVYKGKGAKLQRALINFFLEENIRAGYVEIMPPLMVNEDSGFGTGQLPDKDAQMYHVTIDNFYLIPTAEVPVTNIYRDVILDAAQFPVKNTAYTPCFRREAGSYGKDVRGLNRLHQFDKVEIVQIQHPDKSYESLESMVKHVEGLVRKLELPYRIVRLCGGDMSFTSALTFDFEVFAGAQKRWLEVSSVSNFESFQANRLKLRFREDGNKKPQLAHTLNGSSLALPRIVAALLENNQTSQGIRIPSALVPYTGFDIIEK
ncbi:MAG TPA: serine--tRNA ligase [Bacteroidales bacterium]|jgi:seryl-tRNA synthetase|nr:serine--tRNA ligase [Bacteroidales bacterium]